MCRRVTLCSEREMCGGRRQTKQVIRDDTADRCDGQSKRQPTVAKAKLRSLAAKHLFHRSLSFAEMEKKFKLFASREFCAPAASLRRLLYLAAREREQINKLWNGVHAARRMRSTLPLFCGHYLFSLVLSQAFIFLLVRARGDYHPSSAHTAPFSSSPLWFFHRENSISFIECGRRENNIYTHTSIIYCFCLLMQYSFLIKER